MALQIDKGAKTSLARDIAGRIQPGRTNEVDIRYGGQARYAKNLRDVHTRGGSSAILPRSKALDISGCFNFGASDHMLRKCKLPINAAKAATSRIEYYRKKNVSQPVVHLVLAYFCRQMDEEEDLNDVTDAADDWVLFQQALDGDSNNVLDVGNVRFTNEEQGEKHDIYVLDHEWNDTSSHNFLGACVDSDVQRSVIVVQQSRAYCAIMNERFDEFFNKEQFVYQVVTDKLRGVGRINIRTPISSTYFVSFLADVVRLSCLSYWV